MNVIKHVQMKAHLERTEIVFGVGSISERSLAPIMNEIRTESPTSFQSKLSQKHVVMSRVKLTVVLPFDSLPTLET